MLLLCFGALIILQDPAVATSQASRQAVEASAIMRWDDAEAKAAVTEFKHTIGDKKATLRDRMEAVAILAGGRNKNLVGPLCTVATRDRAISVRVAAADALGHQPKKAARPAVLRILRRSDLNKFPQVQAALIRALDRIGYESRDWKVIKSMFERSYGEDRVTLQKNILILIANNKEKQAIDILLRNLGEPIPEDVDARINPPREYWERRWKAWQVWREDVKKALFEITGQRFSTRKEAKAWLKKNGHKIGLR